MSESNYRPDGKGVVMGDTKAMPDRGTGTGMTGFNVEDGGMSLEQDATNTQGKLSGTDSTPMDECYADDPAVPKSNHNSKEGV